MPGYVIHLTEAKIILDILKRKSQRKGKALNQWQEDFFYGSLLPDAGGRIQKQNSHFWSEAEIGQIIMTPDIDRFLKKYDNVWKQCPLYEGYLAHLHLDREFWKYYIKEQVEFLDADNKPTEYTENLKSVFIKRTDKVISPEEFFSKDYLYGDYTRLNKRLVQKYDLRIPVYNKCHDNRIEEADNEDMCRVLSNLKLYIADSPENETELTILSLDTLEVFLQRTAQQFADLYSSIFAGDEKDK